MALTQREEELAKQIVEAITASQVAENHLRVLTDDCRDNRQPLVRVAYRLRTAIKLLVESVRLLEAKGKEAPATIDCGTFPAP
jgi:hypothetical protein